MTDDILKVLRAASAAILEIYADEDRFHTEIKPDQSPLTEADKRANKIICEALADLHPGIPVISEETKQAPYHERSLYNQYFLVDPLDGTKEFIKRNGEFTINIAYLEGYAPISGFVYVPCTGTAYFAEQSFGAYKLSENGSQIPLQSKPFYLFEPGVRVVASRSHRDPQTEKIISTLNEPIIVATGSSLKFLHIAEGNAHFYPRLAPTMEWDTAAAQCILEEAGGSIVDIYKLSPLIYNKENLLNPHFMAIGALLDPEELISLKA